MFLPQFVLRFDDIAPGMAWSNFAEIDAVARELGIPVLIGVVPDCRDPKLAVEAPAADFWARVRGWRDAGWTIAQHGYTHEYVSAEPGLVSVSRQSEFAGLAYDVQFAKLKAGKDIMLRERVWQPVFMAPSHSFDENTVRALAALQFEYITDGYGMYPYRIGELTAVPQLFASAMHFGFGVYTQCLHPNNMSARQRAELLAWMRRHRRHIVSFYAAAGASCPVPLAAALLRRASAGILARVRRARRGRGG